MSSHKTYGLLIDGKIVKTENSVPILNPSTEEVIAHCSVADEQSLTMAIDAARLAQPAWASTPHTERQKTLVAIADVIKGNMQELATLLVQEQGKPLPHALGEMMGAEYYLRYYASLELPIRVIDQSSKQKVEEHRRPLGIVAAIVPWNFPFIIALYKLAPAILAGNAVIMKPAPTTPLSLLRLGELIKEIVPKGVVQILSDDNNIGPLLTSHPAISKVSFTGSTTVGKAIMRNGSDTLKRLTLELGGNDPAIVLDDADLDSVMPKLYGLAFANCGQVCVAIKRLYVHTSMYDDVCERLAAIAEKIVVGDGLKEGIEMGPMQNRNQFEKILALIETVKAGSGKIVAGGERVGTTGYFIRPTIVRDVDESSLLVAEETFGPILPVMRYFDVDEAVRRANSTSYGLGASVWSSNVERAATVARRLDAGTVWVNQHMVLAPHIPLRGAKQSGLGVENGIEGFHEYTMPQILNISYV